LLQVCDGPQEPPVGHYVQGARGYGSRIKALCQWVRTSEKASDFNWTEIFLSPWEKRKERISLAVIISIGKLRIRVRNGVLLAVPLLVLLSKPNVL
jgi:hypothetical protein